MLFEISKQQINQETVDTVSARELHKFLEVQSKFADWIKNRIGKYGFVENQDYVCVSKILETHRTDGQEGVATTKEYHITLDMAKELAMIENNPKGREARQYFIECEKQLKSLNTPQTFAQALKIAYEQQLLIEQQQSQIGVMKPKAEYFDALVDRNLLINFRDTAKELKLKQKAFIDYLLVHGYVYRDTKGKLKPHAQFTPHLFELKEFKRGEYTDVQTLITPKGRETFRLLLSPN